MNKFRRHSVDHANVDVDEGASSSDSDRSRNSSQTSLNCFGSFGSLGINFKFGFQLRRALSWTPQSDKQLTFPETPKPTPPPSPMMIRHQRKHRVKLKRKRRKRRHTINADDDIKPPPKLEMRSVSPRPPPLPPSRFALSADTCDDILTNRHRAPHTHPAFELNVPHVP
jgi:hypothetical protein